jgi:hypothetical protein
MALFRWSNVVEWRHFSFSHPTEGDHFFIFSS